MLFRKYTNTDPYHITPHRTPVEFYMNIYEIDVLIVSCFCVYLMLWISPIILMIPSLNFCLPSLGTFFFLLTFCTKFFPILFCSTRFNIVLQWWLFYNANIITFPLPLFLILLWEFFSKVTKHCQLYEIPKMDFSCVCNIIFILLETMMKSVYFESPYTYS